MNTMESILEGENMPTAPRPQTGPTFEDLTFDDSLDDMQRIARYSTSAIALQRLVHVRMIGATAKRDGFARTREFIFPLLDTLAADEEFMLRQHLAEQLSGVAEACVKSGGDEGYLAMLDFVLPVIAKLVADNQAEVRIAAGESLVAVAGWVKREDMGPRVLTIVLQLAHDDEQEDLRMTAAVLLNELAETLGPELCHQFVTPEVICLAEDPVFRVRKAAALNLDAVCRTAGPQMAMKRLVPAFLRLCQDDIWGVRKSCAESLVSVSKTLDPQVRVNELIPVFEKFANDQSKWVRNAAFQHIGPFIATLPGAKITPSLLSHYVKMGLSPDSAPPSAPSATTPSNPATSPVPAATARMGSEPGDSELATYCAFSFPAAVVTLGRARWPELRPLFQSLSRDVQRKVRRPLSHSLHEIARILGPEMAEAELLSTFELYLKDVDDVKVGIVRNIAAFLAALSPTTRESYLPVLDEVLSGTAPLNWRFRKLLAAQLPQFAVIFSPAATFSIVTPFAMKLLVDPIAAVREEAIGGFAPLVNRLGQADPSFEVDLVVRLLKLASSTCYRQRLLFVKLCRYLGHSLTGIDPKLFRVYFLSPLLAFVTDPVRNVRLALAHTLAPLSAAAYVYETLPPSTDGELAMAAPDDVQQAPAVAAEPPPESVPAAKEAPPVSSPVTKTTLLSKAQRLVFGSISSLVPSSSRSHATAVSQGAETLPSLPQLVSPASSADANNSGLPAGVDSDMLPRWARRGCELECTKPAGGSDLMASEDVKPAPHMLADNRVAMDILHALEVIVSDNDTEIVRSLSPLFVSRRRELPEPPPSAPSSDDIAIVLTLDDGTADVDGDIYGEPDAAERRAATFEDGTTGMHGSALETQLVELTLSSALPPDVKDEGIVK